MGAPHLSTCVSKPSVLHHPYQTLKYSEATRMFFPSPDIQEGQGQSQSPRVCHTCVPGRVIQNDISFCRLEPSPIWMASVARVPRPWPDSNRPALINVCPTPILYLSLHNGPTELAPHSLWKLVQIFITLILQYLQPDFSIHSFLDSTTLPCVSPPAILQSPLPPLVLTICYLHGSYVAILKSFQDSPLGPKADPGPLVKRSKVLTGHQPCVLVSPSSPVSLQTLGRWLHRPHDASPLSFACDITPG